MKRELIGDLERLRTQTFSDETPGRADPAIAAQPQEVTMKEIAETREQLREIDQAIERIDTATPFPFGVCKRTGMIIESERLELIPWTTLSALGAKIAENEPAHTI